MASTRAVIIAGAVAIGAVNAARAADLDLPPPPPVEAPPPAPVVAGGWYLRGDVGYGFDQLDNVSSNLANTGVPGFEYNGAGIDGQVNVGGGVGYQFNNWFRGDVTAEYRTPTHYSAEESFLLPPRNGDAYNATIYSEDVLANAYFDVGTWYGITPFVGGGVGVAFHQFHGLTDKGTGPDDFSGYGIAPDVSMARFAWAAMAGFDYAISPNWKFEVGYRYLDMGHLTSGGIVCLPTCAPPYETQSFHLTANEVRIGLRYIFAEVPPPAPSLPLVTKY